MVTIKFQLNKENIRNSGHTEQEMIDFLYKFYVVERKAIEIAPLTFQRDDENAMCSFGKIMSIMRKNSEFMDMFSECVWNIDGEGEDIITETLDYEKRHSK